MGVLQASPPLYGRWSQLKQILGKKNSIDKCVKAIWRHQLRIVGGLHSALNQHNASSRWTDSYPAFLREVQQRLSDFALIKVAGENDAFLAHPDQASECAVSRWRAANGRAGSEYLLKSDAGFLTVDVVSWTCSCHHFRTWRLPCRHVMMVAAQHLKLDVLPTTCINARWNVYRGMSLNGAIIRTTDVLIRLDGSTATTLLPDQPPQSRPLSVQRRVAYVRLQRHEQHDVPVLSECEKYNIVQRNLEPLIKALKESPSEKFLSRLGELQDVVQTLLQTWNTVAEGPVAEPELPVPESVDYDDIDVDIDIDCCISPPRPKYQIKLLDQIKLLRSATTLAHLPASRQVPSRARPKRRHR